jgi:hypothetical protein
MRFEILVIIIMLMKTWVLAPCGFVGWYQRFGETCCLHLQGLE